MKETYPETEQLKIEINQLEIEKMDLILRSKLLESLIINLEQDNENIRDAIQKINDSSN